MKSILKRAAVLTIALFAMSVFANAQEKGDMAAGADLAVGMGDGVTNFGIGAKFRYNVLQPLRLEGSFTYFLPKKYGVAGLSEWSLSMWDLSVNGHWLFPVAEKIAVYPLAGLGILGTSNSYDGLGSEYIYGVGSVSSSNVVFNLGGGIDFKLTDKLILNAELKYKLSSVWSRFIISAGFAYKF